MTQAGPIGIVVPPKQDPEARWCLARRVLFRFGFIYFVLYFLPFPLSLLQGLGMLGRPFVYPAMWAGQFAQWYETSLVQKATTWFGYKVMRLSEGAIVIRPTGSGDTMIKYTESAMYVAVALLGTLAWSVIDRKRPAYPRLHWMFRTYIRFALAAILLGYGLAKIPPAQFQPPGPDRLLQTYGNSSPMGLLWTFMGASPAYTMFAGASEVVAAVLLVFRRTATLGGLAGFGVMLNVAMLNYCYDVPVKLFSSHLAFVSLLVAMPDMRRIMNMLVLNRPTAPAASVWRRRARWSAHRLTAAAIGDPDYRLPDPLPCGRCRYNLGGLTTGASCPECGTAVRVTLLGEDPRPPRRWVRWSLPGLEAVAIVLLLVPGMYATVRFWDQRGMNAAKPELYGLYEVEKFELNGEERPPLLTDDVRWRRFIFTRYGQQMGPAVPPSQRVYSAIVHTTSEKREWLGVKYDKDAKTLEVTPRSAGSGQKFTLSLTEPEPGKFVLEGPYKDGTIRVAMKKVPDAEFNIYKRGFNWIQELPVNQ